MVSFNEKYKVRVLFTVSLMLFINWSHGSQFFLRQKSIETILSRQKKISKSNLVSYYHCLNIFSYFFVAISKHIPFPEKPSGKYSISFLFSCVSFFFLFVFSLIGNTHWRANLSLPFSFRFWPQVVVMG